LVVGLVVDFLQFFVDHDSISANYDSFPNNSLELNHYFDR
jgi:hypothetical protein